MEVFRFFPLLRIFTPDGTEEKILLLYISVLCASIHFKTAKDMTKDIQTFNNKAFGTIRTMVDTKGEPMFVGMDVALALGYLDQQKAIKMHVDPEDKLTRQIVVSGQRRNVTLINESGLYSLILSSKLESAKAFKRWVTSEVLPQIRKNDFIKSEQGK